MLGGYRIVIGMLVLTLWGLWSVGLWAAASIGQQTNSDVLAFVSDRDGRRDIYIIDVVHRISLNLTRDRAYNDNPAWSSDGQLSFESYRSGGGAIVLMDTLTSHSRSLTNSIGNYNPAWSTDGQLAYITTSNANLEIMLYDFTTGQRRNVSRNPSDEMNPAWSPDGRIAFDSYREETRSGGIYIMNPETGAVRDIRNSEHYFDPSWSPDGQLAVVSNQAGSGDIYVMDSVTGETQPIVQTPANETQPAWSGHGLLAYVVDYYDGIGEIYVMNLETSETQNITVNSVNDYAPAWMP
jgi:Tol biopolymer transport system component